MRTYCQTNVQVLEHGTFDSLLPAAHYPTVCQRGRSGRHLAGNELVASIYACVVPLGDNLSNVKRRAWGYRAGVRSANRNNLRLGAPSGAYGAIRLVNGLGQLGCAHIDACRTRKRTGQNMQ